MNVRFSSVAGIRVTFLWASKEKSLAPTRHDSEKKYELSGRETRPKTRLLVNDDLKNDTRRLCRQDAGAPRAREV